MGLSVLSDDDGIDITLSAINRLWILRILVPLECHRKLFGNFGFGNDRLAVALGLQKWVDAYDESSEEFDGRRMLAEIRALHRQAEKESHLAVLPEIVAENVQRIAQLVGLSAVDCRILEFAVSINTDQLIDDVAEWLGGLTTPKTLHILSVLLNLPYESVRVALSSGGVLMRSGLLKLDHNSKQLSRKLDLLSRHFAARMVSESVDAFMLLRETIVPSAEPALVLSHFEHLEATIKTLRPYLKHALDTRRVGVNIFLYGAPGTGKTQFARVLTKALGSELFEISSEDADGDLIDGEHRLRAFRVAQNFFGQRAAMLLFDEVEDVFNDGDSLFGRKSTAQTHKAWVNRSLEENIVPTFWLSNSIRGLDPAFVRRFDMMIEVPMPTQKNRERIVQEVCGDLLDASGVKNIAQAEQLAPAVIARAASVVRSIRDELGAAGAQDAVAQFVSATLEAQGHGRLRKDDPNRLPDYYDPAFVNAESSLAKVAEGIAQSRSARICLYGPPGTGKSAFGRWLAEQMGVPLVVKRASDLMSKWVGGTEKNIAEAFHEADTEGAVLLLDEVDSYLQDRREARHSWELTQVNEMLTQMESFSGVFIASTNLMSGLDQAALRRFDLKSKFDYPKPDQAWKLLKKQATALGIKRLAPSIRDEICRLSTLTPGDFAAVARQHRLRPIQSGAALLAALREECAIKAGEQRAGMGFLV